MDRIDLIRAKKGTEESQRLINDLLVYDEVRFQHAFFIKLR